MRHTTNQAITFDDVSFAYQKAPVVERVSLRVAAGEMVALLGPNGAGKSTLLKLATGILRPSRGQILLGERNLRTMSRDEVARRMAVVPQDFSVQFAYTVRQIVELGRLPHMGAWGLARAGDQLAVDEALRETDTAGLADRVFNELSGGERQRVLIALALAQDAGIVLLDEPTAHLDIKHQIETLDLMRRLNRERGLTVLAALHDLNLASRYFPRLMIFRNTIVADGTPSEVLDAGLLSRVYETPVRIGILRGEEHLSVMPPSHGEAALTTGDERPAAVHVFAGGGAGELMMRALADAGVHFTVGPLNTGDSDCALAERLSDLCIVEPPYAPVSPEGLAAARERLLASAACVICPMPIGHGNITLLETALDARRAGTPIILFEPARGLARTSEDGDEDATWAAITARDFTGRAAAVYRALAESGAVWAASPAEALLAFGATRATHSVTS
ncbi:MAG TPA: ABC transporter ATP-binding protein [Ktedonobacterales bacterium]|nr:ABC transporter ATP-binding protein [Ktedonobacterales bacterium]